MKKHLAFFCMLLSVGILNAQTQRLILLEDFTQASSTRAGLSAPGISDMLFDNSGKIVSLQYHTPFPGSDTMFGANATEMMARVNFYGITSVPYIHMDGLVYSGDPDNLQQQDLDARYAVPSAFEMNITHQLSAGLDSIFINAVIVASQNFNGVITAFLAVAERNIYFSPAPGTSGQTRFENVMKKMIPDAQGTALPAVWNAGDSVVISSTWALTGVYDTRQLAVVGWVQDTTTGEVIQAGYSRNLMALDIGVKEAAFNDVICPGDFVPRMRVSNYGTDVLTSCTVGSKINNGPVSNHAWMGMIGSEATGFINLDTVIAVPGYFELASAATIPNFGVDEDPNNDSNYFYYTVIDTIVQPPVSEDFENALFPPAHWPLSNKNNDITWIRANIGGYGQSAYSAGMNFFDGTRNRFDELYLPALSFANAGSGLYLQFDYAYTFFADSNGSRYDTLSLMASTDCGGTWTTLWQKGGSQLSTRAGGSDSAFIPSSAEWITDSVSLNGFVGVPQLLLKFSGKSGRGNNLYLDNILVDDLSGIDEIKTLNNLLAFPNPSDGRVNILLQGQSKVSSSKLFIKDLAGKKLVDMQVTDTSPLYLDLQHLPDGVYFVYCTGIKQQKAIKLVIIH